MTAISPSTSAPSTGGASPIDVERLRRDFPALAQQVNGHPLVYLDSAATSQKPRCVIDALCHYYEHDNANIHRGVHALSIRATDAYEKARDKVQHLLGAARPDEIIFVRGTTEAINLVAQTYGRANVGAGDEILITGLEHHSNIVPWQILCGQNGARLRVAPIDDAGDVVMQQFAALLGPRTKLAAFAHVSNALGTVNPVREMVELARAKGVPTLVDGAQAAPHAPVNVRDIGCDFYTISGHKMFAPTGIGALYVGRSILVNMPPYQGGGEMINSVTFEKTTYNELPHRFEAGTPNIAGAIGLGAAIDYLNAIGMERIAACEHELLAYGTEVLSAIPQVRLVGTAREKAAVLSFTIDGVHPHDAGTILDQQGIAIRTGHHCAQPVMDRYNLPATCRASLALYNTRADLDAIAAGVRKVIEVFSV
jgi:cysteine desulfurase/selenocysteine lyase